MTFEQKTLIWARWVEIRDSLDQVHGIGPWLHNSKMQYDMLWDALDAIADPPEPPQAQSGWTCFPDADGNWYVTFGERKLVGVILYKGKSGTLPFQVYQTKPGQDYLKTYIGDCATVDQGVDMIKNMEEMRPPGRY